MIRSKHHRLNPLPSNRPYSPNVLDSIYVKHTCYDNRDLNIWVLGT